MTPSFVSGADLLGTWWADVTTGPPPVRYTLPEPFDLLDVRPSRLLIFGGAPGRGKTSSLLQIGIDLLRFNPTARLMIVNVEMAPVLLLERIIARLSGVPLTNITDRLLTPSQVDRVQAAVAAFAPVAARLAFLSAPFHLEHVAVAATEFGVNALILDYLQRVPATAADVGKDKREQLETAATILRRFCDLGVLVLAASAVARQRGRNGSSSYEGLGLASFRNSSEIEYGCDAAYLIERGEAGNVVFRCEKSRFAEPRDIVARFDPTTQTFRPAPVGLNGFDETAPAGEND